MTKVRVAAFTVSADGYGAGPDQDLSNPLGRGGHSMMQWLMSTRTFQHDILGQDRGSTGTDDTFAARSFENIGANIMGRNMFGPVRGPWPDHDWKGWWGPNPPYHTQVFVLTHHPRPSLEMEGGTVFHFTADPIDQVLDRAKAAAGGRDVRINGGTATLRAFLAAGLIDELHLAQSPVLLGSGEAVFAGLDLPALGYRTQEHVPGENAMHLLIKRKAGAG
jgi:dihydrofolate reductase